MQTELGLGLSVAFSVAGRLTAHPVNRLDQRLIGARCIGDRVYQVAALLPALAFSRRSSLPEKSLPNPLGGRARPFRFTPT